MIGGLGSGLTADYTENADAEFRKYLRPSVTSAVNDWRFRKVFPRGFSCGDPLVAAPPRYVIRGSPLQMISKEYLSSFWRPPKCPEVLFTWLTGNPCEPFFASGRTLEQCFQSAAFNIGTISPQQDGFFVANCDYRRFSIREKAIS